MVLRFLILWTGTVAFVAAPTYHLLEAPPGVTYDVSLTCAAQPEALAKGEVRLLFDYQDAQNYAYLRLHRERASFMRVREGREEPIGVAGRLQRFEPPEELRLVLQRRAWLVRLLCNGVLVAQAEWPAPAEGRVGFSIDGSGLVLSEPTVQPVEEVFFADDFMRTGGEFGAWEVVVGEWRNNRHNTFSAGTQHSANAFSFKALPYPTPGERQGKALAVAGYPFWSDYLAEVSACCRGTGAAGLVVNYQDEDNYLLFRWSSADHPDGGRKQLIRRFRGKETVLVELPGGMKVETWYKLRAAVSGGWVLLWADDVPLCEVPEPTLGRGLVGLYAEAPPEGKERVREATRWGLGSSAGPRSASSRGVLFDDVQVRSWPVFVEDFARPSRGRWEVAAGRWNLTAGSGWAKPETSQAVLVGGQPTWADYTVSVDLRAGRGTVGLAVHWCGAQDFYLFRWTEKARQLVKVRGGKERVLAERPGRRPRTWQRVVFHVQRGRLTVSVGGEECLRAWDYDLPQGRIALWAEKAPEAAFDNLLVTFSPVLTPPKPTVPPAFARDPYMTTWATPRGDWTPAPRELGTLLHKGYFFGDRSVVFTLPEVGRRDGQVTVGLHPSAEALTEGYTLTVVTEAGSRAVQFFLRQGERTLAAGACELPTGAQAAQFRFERYEGRLVVWLNEEPVLQVAAEPQNVKPGT